MRQQSFDFWRSIALFSVLLTHSEFYDSRAISVDLFFVLSGFLVGASLRKHIQQNPRQGVWIFLYQRLSKILPTYYIFVIVVFVLSYFYLSPSGNSFALSLKKMPQFLFFYRNYAGESTNWTADHLWSLCVEMHFYFLLAFGVYFLQKISPKLDFNLLFWASLSISIGFLSKWQAFFTHFAEYPTFTHNRLDAFGAGLWLMLYLQSTKKVQKIFWYKPLTYFFSALGLYFLAFQDQSLHFLLLRICSVGACVFLLLSLFHYSIFLGKLWKFISKISYQVYLWHLIFLIPFQEFVSHWQFFYAPFCLIWAIPMTFWIEIPIKKYLDSLLHNYISAKTKPQTVLG